MPPSGNNDSKNTKSTFQALGLAWELGYTIAIPLVVLALAGRLADRWYGTSPLFLLVAVFISVLISTWLVYRKTKSIVTQTDSQNHKLVNDGQNRDNQTPS